MAQGPQDERSLNLRTARTNQQSFSTNQQHPNQNSSPSLNRLQQPMTIRPAVVIKDQQEVSHLKQVISRLTTALNQQQEECHQLQTDLRKYQDVPQFPKQQPPPQDDDLVQKMLSGHMLAPLFQEYESVVDSQKVEIQSLTAELKKQLGCYATLEDENRRLVTELKHKTEEHLKFIQDQRAMPNSKVVSDENGQEQGGDFQRIQLLTEENQVLFEQITLLRAHTDHILHEYGTKTEEAQLKIARYDQLDVDYEACRQERDDALSNVAFLESKLVAFQTTMESLEESRRGDQQELVKMREQLTLFQNEYNFYKDVAAQLELKQGTSLDQVTKRLSQLQERERDFAEQKLSKQNEEMIKLKADQELKTQEVTRLQAELTAQQKLREQMITQFGQTTRQTAIKGV